MLAQARAVGATIARPGAKTFWGGYPRRSSTPTAIPRRSPTTPAGR